jgi:hypothetical protein
VERVWNRSEKKYDFKKHKKIKMLKINNIQLLKNPDKKQSGMTLEQMYIDYQQLK